MICIKLQGGFGNQLFQYAAAMSLADFHKTTVGFDLRFLNKQGQDQKHTMRAYALDLFAIPFEELTFLDEIALNLRRLPIQYGIQKILNQSKKWITYDETSLLYEPDIRKLTSKNSYLTGYFQSEYYFKTVEDKIRKVCQFTNMADNWDSDRIMRTNSVSMHVRRGDYILNPDVHRYHGLCSVDYYEKAVRFIAERQADLHLFVFSDDITWARRHLQFPFPTHFLSYSQEEDLWLMSCCQCHIIANSSFSWWGAWLNKNPKKIVVAPVRWFADDKAESQSLTIVPETWVRI